MDAFQPVAGVSHRLEEPFQPFLAVTDRMGALAAQTQAVQDEGDHHLPVFGGLQHPEAVQNMLRWYFQETVGQGIHHREDEDGFALVFGDDRRIGPEIRHHGKSPFGKEDIVHAAGTQ